MHLQKFRKSLAENQTHPFVNLHVKQFDKVKQDLIRSLIRKEEQESPRKELKPRKYPLKRADPQPNTLPVDPECYKALGLAITKISLARSVHSRQNFRANKVAQPQSECSTTSRSEHKTCYEAPVSFRSVDLADATVVNPAASRAWSARKSLNSINTQDYLYIRLAGSQIKPKQDVNEVYERRIKSYTEFLFKIQLAHSLRSNLDLKSEESFHRGDKIVAYIGNGNNSLMIKSLLTRRFWWVISDELNEDCSFVWTQNKVNRLFNLQKQAGRYRPNIQDDFDNRLEEKKPKKLTLIAKKNSDNLRKILTSSDESILAAYTEKYQASKGYLGRGARPFSYRYDTIEEQFKQLRAVQPSLMTNHMQHNYYLGNKKALFHNLKDYYNLTGGNLFDVVPLTFHIKKGTKDLEYSRFVAYYQKRRNAIKKLQKMAEEGKTAKARNIWIVKPGENSNQGRGITVIDEVYELDSILKRQPASGQSGSQELQSTYIVQAYLDRPLLYCGRKFDLRHYMLFTSIQGVFRAYWYDQGYVRTSSYEFNIEEFDPQIHLTNDAIQKHYPEYGRHQPFNKLSYEQLQKYLQSTCGKAADFKNKILPQMKSIATDAARSVYTKIAPGNPQHNFEIFGLDFMIDCDLKPWLIEINTNPCLDCQCPLLARIIPYMVQQALKLSLDVIYPPPMHYPNTAKHNAPLVDLPNFKYDLIFDETVHGDELLSLYRNTNKRLLQEIGAIEDDEEFNCEGREANLAPFT